MTTLSTKLLGTTYAIALADLPEASRVFLLEYGFKQYVADGAAVTKFDKDGNERTDAEIEALKFDGIDKRMANVASGDFARTVTRDPFDAECRRVATAMLKAAFKASKKTWPEGKDNREVREALFAKLEASAHWPQIEATARENLDRAAALAALDID